MAFRIPQALAGTDNEVSVDEDGARTVAELVAGTALAAAILAGGGMVYQKFANVVGTESQVSDLY